MHHHKTYMYTNFQQNRVSRSVRIQNTHPISMCTVRTNILARNCKLPKFATNNSNLKKNRLFPTCVIVKRTCISIFSKRGLVDQSKPCTLIYLPKNDKLHRFSPTNSNFEKKSILLDMHHHKTCMYINFQQIVLKDQS